MLIQSQICFVASLEQEEHINLYWTITDNQWPIRRICDFFTEWVCEFPYCHLLDLRYPWCLMIT